MCNPACKLCPDIMSCAVHAYKLCVILHPIVFYGENYTFYIPYLIETIIATITHIASGTYNSHSWWAQYKKKMKLYFNKSDGLIFRIPSKIVLTCF